MVAAGARSSCVVPRRRRAPAPATGCSTRWPRAGSANNNAWIARGRRTRAGTCRASRAWTRAAGTWWRATTRAGSTSWCCSASSTAASRS
ncbi:MAG: hypothetical protein MZW92_57750 [Comamonadaceae bacterium]|nr:hypothetical protein [Comamonadaceae bacterium]